MAVARQLSKAEPEEVTHRATQPRKLGSAAAIEVRELSPQTLREGPPPANSRGRPKALFEDFLSGEERLAVESIGTGTVRLDEEVWAAKSEESGPNSSGEERLEIAQAGYPLATNAGVSSAAQVEAGTVGATTAGAFAGGGLGMVAAAAGGLVAIAAGGGGGGKSSAQAPAPQVAVPANPFETLTLDETSVSVTAYGNARADLVQLVDGNKIVRISKPVGAEIYGGVAVAETMTGTVKALPFTTTQTTLTAWVYSEKAGVTVRMQVESSNPGTVHQYNDPAGPLIADDRNFVAAEAVTTTVGWQKLTFDFNNPVERFVEVYGSGTDPTKTELHKSPLNLKLTYDKINLAFDFNKAADGTVYYVDSIGFGSAATTKPSGLEFKSVSTTATLVDGYISGATVFQDNDRDGVIDADEPRASTDGSGAFTLAINPNGGPIVAIGGTDLGTGKLSTNIFKATPSSTVVSPLTTLINELVRSGKTEAEAATSVAKALGLEGLDLKSFDPIQEATDPNGTATQAAIKVSAAAVMVANLMDMGASVLKGAGSTLANDSGTMAASLAASISQAPAGQVLDLSSPSTIKAVLNSAAAASLAGNDSAIAAVANSADVAATVMAASNAQAAAAAQSTDPIEALSLLAKTQAVALESASAALESAVNSVKSGGTASLSALMSSFTGTELSKAVNAAQVGLITSAIKVANVETVPLEVKIPDGAQIQIEPFVAKAAINLGGYGADGILSAGQSASISIRFNGVVTSFDASDVKLSAGLTLSAFTQVNPSLFTGTITATPAAQGAQSVSIGTDWNISGSVPVAQVERQLFVGAFTQLSLEEGGVTVVGFEGAVATLQEQAGGNHIVKVVKPAGARPYAGLTVGENDSLTVKQLPFDAEHKTLSMWVYSPKAGATVRMELGSSSVDPVHQYLMPERPLIADDRTFVAAEATTTKAGWQQLTFDFSKTVSRFVAVYGEPQKTELNTQTAYDKINLFFDFNKNADGAAYYFDGIVFGNGIAPQPADIAVIPEPPPKVVFVSEDFTDTLPTIVGFEGAGLGSGGPNTWGSSTVVQDPGNAQNKVVQVIKDIGAQPYAGTTLKPTEPIVFSVDSKLSLRVWSEETSMPVMLKLEGSGAQVVVQKTQAGWQTLTFDFAGKVQSNTPYSDGVSVFLNYDGTGKPAQGNGKTYYFDDLAVGSNQEVITVPTGYQLVFADEFDTAGKASPDASKWTFDLGDGSKLGIPGWGNGEQQYYTADLDNSFVQDGSLHIVAKAGDAAENTTDRVNADGQVVPFTSGITSARLTTSGWKLPAYGYVEVSAKLPDAKGAWPAIWMLGQDGQWPAKGEIDIAEWSAKYFNSNTIQAALHYSKDYGDTSTKSQYILDDPVTNFHKYQLWWSETEIRIGVDGDYNSAYFTYTKQPGWSSDQWPFYDPQYLLLNVAVGGMLGGNGYAEALSAAPYDMVVDYVRVYQAPTQSMFCQVTSR